MNEDTALQLLAPVGNERLVGAAFTTFSLDTRFLEEELLTTLAGLPVSTGESMRVSSELHEWMLGVEFGISVLVDERSFNGGRLLGGYDIQLVPAPPTFHPKVSLTLWENPSGARTARATVASANLTRDGYRRNAEIIVAADGARPSDRRLLLDVAQYLQGLGPNGSALFREARAALGPPASSRRRLLASRGRPLIEALIDELQPAERIRGAIVVSPYFEPAESSPTASVMETWCSEVVARAAAKFSGLRFYVPPIFDAEGLRVEIPIARAVDIAGAANVKLFALDGSWPAGQGSSEQVLRALHAKLLCLETTQRCLVLVGSANFSNAALLLPGPAANWEACVLLSLAPGASADLIPVSATEQDPAQARYVESNPEPDPPPLIFRSASYRAAALDLRVEPAMVVAPTHWELLLDGDRQAEGPEGKLTALRIQLRRHPIEFALEVRTEAGTRYVPIEVLDKENLPLPGRRAQPTGDDVLDYFAGLRTPGRHDAEQEEADPSRIAARPEELPALEHLSRFSRALFGLRDHLERTARSELEYRARWTGPWGANKMREGLEHRFVNRIDDPAYSLFECWELHDAFSRLRLEEDPQCSLDAKEDLRRDAIELTVRLRSKIERAVGDEGVAGLLSREYSRS